MLYGSYTSGETKITRGGVKIYSYKSDPCHMTICHQNGLPKKHSYIPMFRYLIPTLQMYM